MGTRLETGQRLRRVRRGERAKKKKRGYGNHYMDHLPMTTELSSVQGNSPGHTHNTQDGHNVL